MSKNKNKATEPDSGNSAEELAAATLTGDVRDTVLGWIRNMQKPWQKMSESEQQAVVSSVTANANHLVREAVKIVAGEGRKAMIGTLESVTIKDGIKATLKLSKTAPERHDLIDCQGAQVMLVVAEVEPFQGERAPAEIDPDQADLSLEEAA